MTEEVIKFLGGSALLLAAAAWLIRSLISHFLSKDVEGFKTQLQSQSAVTLERLRHDLRLVAAQHENQIQLLQERRAAVIAELYSKLIAFVGAAESFASLAEWSGEPSKEEKAKTLGEKAGDFREYFLRHKIYFTDDTCAKVESLWQEVHQASMKFRVRLAYSKSGSNSTALKLDEAWDNAWTVMKDKAPLLVKAVEIEFRTLLGVTPEQKGGTPKNEI